MLLIPAIDLKDGHCVRLVQGDMNASTTFAEHPADQALKWVRAGGRRLHLVDLNGAFAGKPVNEPAIKAIALMVEHRIRTIPIVTDTVAGTSTPRSVPSART